MTAGAVSMSLLTGGCGEDHEAEEAAAFSQAFDELEEGKADDNGCSGVLTPDRGGFGKRVALTFDDGPDGTTTPQVLDILREEGIQATFFINGSDVNSSTRPLLQRMIDEGHILANHSQQHKNLARESLGTVREQVERTQTRSGGSMHRSRPPISRTLRTPGPAPHLESKISSSDGRPRAPRSVRAGSTRRQCGVSNVLLWSSIRS